MSCHISSFGNRTYAALESAVGLAAAVSVASRLPITSLRLREVRTESERRDKTGGRTYFGAPSNGRERAEIRFGCYLTEWDTAAGFPATDNALRAVTGGAVQECQPNTIAAVAGGRTITTALAHGLQVGQAFYCGGEIRFVDSVVSTTVVVANYPLSSSVVAGAPIQRTVTYRLGDELRSLSMYDYWDPAAAIQRCIAGVALDEVSVGVNGDFHEMTFSGEGQKYVDSASFIAGAAGLTEFPPEPTGTWQAGALVPGTIGQAWIGATSSESYNVLLGTMKLVNNVDYRRREFGSSAGGCITAGIRDVRMELRLRANDSSDMNGLFSASRRREPVPVMFQLGEAQGQTCGVYLPQVVMEAPTFDDSGPSLEWIIRNARAQGGYNDELSIAFA